ncbi:hypothetical protein D3C87_1626510 [compost metagenome]
MQTAAQFTNAHYAVLAQRKLQQLLAVVIRWQARRFTGLQVAIEALRIHPEAGMGGVQQVQLCQLTTAELGQSAHEVTQQRSSIRRSRQAGELRK